MWKIHLKILRLIKQNKKLTKFFTPKGLINLLYRKIIHNIFLIFQICIIFLYFLIPFHLKNFISHAIFLPISFYNRTIRPSMFTYTLKRQITLQIRVFLAKLSQNFILFFHLLILQLIS